jgi:hypothetical protein
MAAGRVDVRMMKHSGKARLRFYGVAPDHLETILKALAMAREELNTEYDTVALEAICLLFIMDKAEYVQAGIFEKLLSMRESMSCPQ